MLTAHELESVEMKCRYLLAKRGLKLQKQRYSQGMYFNPANCRYRITETMSAGGEYPLRIEDVMQAVGIA